MNKVDKLVSTKSSATDWQHNYEKMIGQDRIIKNRSGIEVKPLYWPQNDPDGSYGDKLGFPGADPMTRGIYPTMHRGRTWSQRQLIGLGRPADFNERIKSILKSGASALSIIPCNSVYRGLDCDEVEPEILGTCGTILNTVEDMDISLKDIPIDEISIGLNDPNPFTMLAQMLIVAESRGIGWDKITGTSNQSDYISHFVANHMFYRLSLSGAKRVQMDTIAYLAEHVPNWNALSIVGQHMQQAGATPDPSSPITGGAVLGDRIRMAEHTMDDGVFIRSLASRGHLGGLSASAARVADLMDAAGYDVVVLETVGAGQSEVEMAEMADVRIVVSAPGLGDDVQAIKAGILEIADILVVNKDDLPLANRTLRQLESMLALRAPSDWKVPVLSTNAVARTGLPELADAIERKAEGRATKGARAELGSRTRRLLAQTVAKYVEDHILRDQSPAAEAIISALQQAEIDLRTATTDILNHIHESLPDE